ncbi:hypothetical protein A2U01_0092549, partial [Trifolium medium]|nr:hypothetical protein [Trifolium medium]
MKIAFLLHVLASASRAACAAPCAMLLFWVVLSFLLSAPHAGVDAPRAE